MNLIKDTWRLSPSKKELRSFSWLVGSLSLILLTVGIIKSSWLFIIPFALLSLLVAAGQFVRPLLILFYRLWMSLAHILGALMSRLILSLIFYLIFSPIGMILRLLNRQPLDLKINKDQPSYWRARKQGQSDLTKMH
ncbi:SxtJ family membrane protein [Calditrichota bacterium LG25]